MSPDPAAAERPPASLRSSRRTRLHGAWRSVFRAGGFVFRIRTRLLLVNVLIAAVPIVGIGFARFYEREVLRALEQDMVHQAQLLRSVLLAAAPPVVVGSPPAVDNDPLRLGDRKKLLVEVARETRTRLRLLDAAGALVADSHANGPPEGPEGQPEGLLYRSRQVEGRAHKPAADYLNLSSRREIKEALAGRYGAATRIWEDGDRVFLFGAVPIVRGHRVEGVVYVTRSTAPVRLAMRRLRSKLFRVLIATLLATSILTLFLAGTVSVPLTRLSRLADRIAGGDRNVRLATVRRDEIGQLARAFDRMARKLDDRARYIAELCANISHEFKSPLTSVRGAAELLLDGAADDPQARDRFLENILGDAHRLDRLVTRLLELSRVEADAADPEALDLRLLLEESASRATGVASGPALVPVIVTVRARDTRLLGRRAHLASALDNLIENACRHAAPGSIVDVELCDAEADADGAADARLRVAVHNDGEAIGAANLARIWDRFFTTRGAEGGTGLGLPIVRTVVTAHGGSVTVHSTPEEGTTFSFDLPRGDG